MRALGAFLVRPEQSTEVMTAGTVSPCVYLPEEDEPPSLLHAIVMVGRFRVLDLPEVLPTLRMDDSADFRAPRCSDVLCLIPRFLSSTGCVLLRGMLNMPVGL